MIKFENFFKEVILKGKVKVKFNMNTRDKDLPDFDFDFDSDRWMNMNCLKSKQANNNYSDAEYVLSFAQYYPYGSDYYIFGGLYEIEEIKPEVYDQVGYKLTLQNEFKEYIKNNFTYAILENFDIKTKDEYIYGREQYWIEVLQTKKLE